MASLVAQVSMNNVSAAGNGTTIDFLSARSLVGAMVFSNGTVTGGLVSIQVSQDGTSWATVAYFSPLTGTAFTYGNPSGAYRFWRGVIVSAIAGGGSVDVTFMEGH